MIRSGKIALAGAVTALAFAGFGAAPAAAAPTAAAVDWCADTTVTRLGQQIHSVSVKNVCSFTLDDAYAHVYSSASGFRYIAGPQDLAPGQAITVHTSGLSVPPGSSVCGELRGAAGQQWGVDCVIV